MYVCIYLLIIQRFFSQDLSIYLKEYPFTFCKKLVYGYLKGSLLAFSFYDFYLKE